MSNLRYDNLPHY